MRPLIFIACATLVVAATRSARAAPDTPVYRVTLDLDLPIVMIAGAVASTFVLRGELEGPRCAPRCDGSRVNFLDRPVVGLYSRTWSIAGDVATAVFMAFPSIAIIADEGFTAGVVDNVVILEAPLVASALQVSLAYAIERPRPRTYGDAAPLEDRTHADAGRSFFSGHVANVMAVTIATMRTFQRAGEPGLSWMVLGVGGTGTAFVGLARVLAGGHFPTDVLAGAAVGIGLGFALPALHDDARARSTAVATGAAPTVGAGSTALGRGVSWPALRDVSFQVAPVLHPGGAGITIFGALR